MIPSSYAASLQQLLPLPVRVMSPRRAIFVSCSGGKQISRAVCLGGVKSPEDVLMEEDAFGEGVNIGREDHHQAVVVSVREMMKIKAKMLRTKSSAEECSTNFKASAKTSVLESRSLT